MAAATASPPNSTLIGIRGAIPSRRGWLPPRCRASGLRTGAYIAQRLTSRGCGARQQAPPAAQLPTPAEPDRPAHPHHVALLIAAKGMRTGGPTSPSEYFPGTQQRRTSLRPTARQNGQLRSPSSLLERELATAPARSRGIGDERLVAAGARAKARPGAWLWSRAGLTALCGARFPGRGCSSSAGPAPATRASTALMSPSRRWRHGRPREGQIC